MPSVIDLDFFMKRCDFSTTDVNNRKIISEARTAMKFINRTVFAGGLFIILIALSCTHEREVPQKSLVLFNGNIITVDASQPRADTVIVKGDRITFVGTYEKAKAHVPPQARVIDLRGKTLIPGFNDDHTHTFGAGNFFERPLLWGKSCEEITEIVRAETARKEPGELITGNSWDYTTCPNPHKSMLDRVAPDNPVFLYQYSGHAAWVNSKKLEELGIDRDTPDPKGGQIVRDENGEPTGILRDTAMGTSNTQYLTNLIIPSRHRSIIDRMLKLYREAGITSVQDNTWEPFTALLLARYRDDGKLTCRFTCWPYGDIGYVRHLMLLASYDDRWVLPGPTKHFADGAFSTRTGWLSEAYADEPQNYGSPRYTDEEIEDVVMSAAQDRRQITFHAIGDRAVHQVIDAIEKAQQQYPWTKTLRFRIEHVQIVMPEDIPRMKALGIVACVQPFTLCTPRKDITLLGPERAKQAYPFYSMFKAGVHLAFGSDVPAEVDYQPLLALYYAVTRKNKEGTFGPLNASECFTPLEALYCYTMGSAYAEFMEAEKGSITEGKLADMVILSEDLTAVKPERIKGIDVLMTIVGGSVVYERKGAF